jgi:hypothetical protein
MAGTIFFIQIIRAGEGSPCQNTKSFWGLVSKAQYAILEFIK